MNVRETLQYHLQVGLPIDPSAREYVSLLLQLVPPQYQHYRDDLKQVLQVLMVSGDNSFSEGLWITSVEQWQEVQDLVVFLNKLWTTHIVVSLNEDELPLVTFTYTVV